MKTLNWSKKFVWADRKTKITDEWIIGILEDELTMETIEWAYDQSFVLKCKETGYILTIDDVADLLTLEDIKTVSKGGF